MSGHWVLAAERLVNDLEAEYTRLEKLVEDPSVSVVGRIAAQIQLDRVQRAVTGLREIWPHLPDIQRRREIRLNRLAPTRLCHRHRVTR